MIKEYNDLKYSGLDWIGMVPEHWKISPLKHCFKFQVGFTPSTKNHNYFGREGHDWVNISDLDKEIITETKSKITDEALDDYGKSLTPEGSLLYSFKLSVGKVAFAGKDLYTNEAIFSILPDDEINLRFYYYCLPEVLIHNANENIYGAKIFNQTVIKNSKLPVPSPEEQTKIAEYLDHQTGLIDAIIEKKQQLIEKLKEQRQAIINEAVTKGLDPDAPMKDSGVEWLGEIPEHWEVIKLRYLADITTGDKDTENKEENGEYPFYVRSQKVEKISSYSFDGEAILTAGDGVGVCKVWHYVDGKFDYHQRVYMMYNFRKVSGNYLFHFLKENFIHEVLKLSAKSTVDSLRRPMFLSFPVAVPSEKEQELIVQKIEANTQKIDLSIKKLKIQLEKLDKYRQSIISEAVTGKIDVREWEPKIKEAV